MEKMTKEKIEAAITKQLLDSSQNKDCAQLKVGIAKQLLRESKRDEPSDPIAVMCVSMSFKSLDNKIGARMFNSMSGNMVQVFAMLKAVFEQIADGCDDSVPGIIAKFTHYCIDTTVMEDDDEQEI